MTIKESGFQVQVCASEFCIGIDKAFTWEVWNADERVISRGYASTKSEAGKAARKARKEAVANL